MSLVDVLFPAAVVLLAGLLIFRWAYTGRWRPARGDETPAGMGGRDFYGVDAYRDRAGALMVVLLVPDVGHVHVPAPALVERTPLSYIRLRGDEDCGVDFTCDYPGCKASQGGAGIAYYTGDARFAHPPRFDVREVEAFMRAVRDHAEAHFAPTPGQQADEDQAAELAEDARRDDAAERTAQ